MQAFAFMDGSIKYGLPHSPHGSQAGESRPSLGARASALSITVATLPSPGDDLDLNLRLNCVVHERLLGVVAGVSLEPVVAVSTGCEVSDSVGDRE